MSSTNPKPPNNPYFSHPTTLTASRPPVSSTRGEGTTTTMSLSRGRGGNKTRLLCPLSVLSPPPGSGGQGGGSLQSLLSQTEGVGSEDGLQMGVCLGGIEGIKGREDKRDGREEREWVRVCSEREERVW